MSTPYHIKIAPAAERVITTLSSRQQKTLLQYFSALAINPRPPGANKIDGMTGLYSDLVDTFRIVYKIENSELMILLVK